MLENIWYVLNGTQSALTDDEGMKCSIHHILSVECAKGNLKMQLMTLRNRKSKGEQDCKH